MDKSIKYCQSIIQDKTLLCHPIRGEKDKDKYSSPPLPPLLKNILPPAFSPKTQRVSQIMGEVLASRHLPLPPPPTRPVPHAPPPPFPIFETLLSFKEALLPQLK